MELIERVIPRQDEAQLQLGLRNLYILPSRFGCLWLSGAVLLLVVAIQTQQNGPLLLSYLMLSLMLLALPLTHFNLHGLTLACTASHAGFAGSPSIYNILIVSQHQREGLHLQWHGAKSEACHPLTIAPGRQTAALIWTPHRRGWQRPGKLRLRSSAPLGLFQCWSVWHPPLAQLIYPRRRRGPVGDRSIHADCTSAANPSQHASGNGMQEWRDLRPHRPEDGSRRLAWKQLAQGRGRLSKQFETQSNTLTVLAPAEGVPAEQALEHLCERIWTLSQSDEMYGLALPDRQIMPARGLTHRDDCLKTLALQP